MRKRTVRLDRSWALLAVVVFSCLLSGCGILWPRPGVDGPNGNGRTDLLRWMDQFRDNRAVAVENDLDKL